MGRSKDNFDMADLLVNRIENKLEKLVHRSCHADNMTKALVPTERQCLEGLIEIQREHDDLEAKYLQEKAALESKYQKLYQPLYSKRCRLVTGVTTEGGKLSGVREFWLLAMKNNEVLAEEITERDERALKYLKDIKWSKVEEEGEETRKGFKLEFFFDAENNPYFRNSVLTKTYHMIGEDEREPVVEEAIGTDIEWYPGKCLTQKQKLRTETEHCASFFDFFDPPQLPEDEEEEDEMEMDKVAAEAFENRMELDYEVGRIIRDKIIPRAVSWLTGEAVQW